jgi:hypothetical protein
MHHFARDPDGRIPFPVTLWDYAATDPPQRSVAGHIEHTLETFYQCPAPPGLVDLLLRGSRCRSPMLSGIAAARNGSSGGRTPSASSASIAPRIAAGSALVAAGSVARLRAASAEPLR